MPLRHQHNNNYTTNWLVVNPFVPDSQTWMTLIVNNHLSFDCPPRFVCESYIKSFHSYMIICTRGPGLFVNTENSLVHNQIREVTQVLKIVLNSCSSLTFSVTHAPEKLSMSRKGPVAPPPSLRTNPGPAVETNS